jgi:hypothetical protein
MLNRASGWLLFLQASYLASFAVFAIIDVLTRGAVIVTLSHVRAALHLDNTFVSFSDYIYYPMVFSALINLGFMVAFFWIVLRQQHSPSLPSDFFSILNAVYLAASGWILFMAFINLVHK